MARTLFGVAGGLGILASAALLLAHHSVVAEFNVEGAPVAISGVVRKVDWGNPHIYTHVETKDASGRIIVYVVEGSTPKALECSGWKKDSLKPGDTVAVRGFRARNPASLMLGLATVTTPGGMRVYELKDGCADWWAR